MSFDPGDPGAPARAAFIAPETRWVELRRELPLDLGGALRGVRIAYRSWGELDAAGENAVVVCHALTGSADADRWWTGMFGAGRALDPERDFIVCSNLLGSCYGTTGPTSLNPETGRAWLGDFPAITVRDMVRAQRELLRELGVKRVRMVVGGSLGGMQTLEWALCYPELVDSIVPIACSGRHSAWAIGLSEAQRQAIYADPRWRDGRYDLADPPQGGLSAARMMAMCMYRHKWSFDERFGRRPQTADLFAIESYLQYQGQQLVDRFDAATYVTLTRAMDTHDVARARGDFDEVLRSVRMPTLIVSIDSDVLYWPDEQDELARNILGAQLVRLPSKDGHDAFLIDVDWLSEVVAEFRGRPTERRSTISRPTARAAAEVDVDRQEVSLFVLGKGKVGGELLDQIARQRPVLERDYDVSLRVIGIADSRRTLLDDDDIDLARWRELLASAPECGPFQLPSARPLLERLGHRAIPVLVDLTAADGMERIHGEAFRCGVHVITANKRPLAVPWKDREQVMAERRQRHRHYHYETTVGAALPVIDTLKTLVSTGDRVHRIEGSISGTLGFVTSEVMKGAPLSLSVRWARELGYTEADPRDDLSGLDAARKAVILARELGLHVDVADVEVEPLTSDLAPGSLQDLYQSLRRYDDAMAERCQRLRHERRALRYLARITVEDGRGKLRVGPVEVSEAHRAARLQGIEAYVAFTTDRHDELPLVVQGAGVGGALTAGAVLAEIFKLAAGHGAR